MHLAVSTSDIETWLAVNTLYCTRHHARLTVAACASNRQQSLFDMRCEGCGGLDDQPPPALQTLHLLLSGFSDNPPEQDTEDCASEMMQQLEHLTDHATDQGSELLLWEEENLLVALDHIESIIPGIAHDVAALVDEDVSQPDSDPGEALLNEAAARDRQARSERGRRFLVFTGRCARCDGYMAYDPDKQFDEQDHDSYHCLACGWRTSPTYAFNRKHE